MDATKDIELHGIVFSATNFYGTWASKTVELRMAETSCAQISLEVAAPGGGDILASNTVSIATED